MKKSLIMALSAVMSLFLLSGVSSAQGRFGVVGGISFSNAERQSLNRSTMNKYHVGVTYQLKLPFGFSIQPALQYHVKGAKLGNIIPDFQGNNTCDLTVGYLELPVSFQWGPDLLLFRPFLDVTPYIGYGLNNRIDAYVEGYEVEPYRNRWSGADMKRFEYGLGVGVGMEIWKFQVVGRYNWNFGSLYTDVNGSNDFKLNMIKEAFSNGHNLGGFTLSVSFLF